MTMMDKKNTSPAIREVEIAEVSNAVVIYDRRLVFVVTWLDAFAQEHSCVNSTWRRTWKTGLTWMSEELLAICENGKRADLPRDGVILLHDSDFSLGYAKTCWGM